MNNLLHNNFNLEGKEIFIEELGKNYYQVLMSDETYHFFEQNKPQGKDDLSLFINQNIENAFSLNRMNKIISVPLDSFFKKSVDQVKVMQFYRRYDGSQGYDIEI